MDTRDSGHACVRRAVDMLVDETPIDEVVAYLHRETVAEAIRSIREYGPDTPTASRNT